MFEPAYIKRMHDGSLAAKAKASLEMLEMCQLCPKKCGVNRSVNEKGFCQVGAHALVASASPHFGEESPLVGSNGSGTIFFTSCNLKCVFCQNFEISTQMEGHPVNEADLGSIMLMLQSMGCHNINVVTPSHVVPQILQALTWAAEKGLRLPLVYNTGGYDSVDTLKLLDGVVDIYMPDLKFMDSKVSADLMGAYDYPAVAMVAIREMWRQVGALQIDERGIATRGLLVRHLVMPNDLAGTCSAMRFLATEISRHVYVNIMNQYRPEGHARENPLINRPISRKEYAEAIKAAKYEGLNMLDDRTAFRFFRMF